MSIESLKEVANSLPKTIESLIVLLNGLAVDLKKISEEDKKVEEEKQVIKQLSKLGENQTFQFCDTSGNITNSALYCTLSAEQSLHLISDDKSRLVLCVSSGHRSLLSYGNTCLVCETIDTHTLAKLKEEYNKKYKISQLGTGCKFLLVQGQEWLVAYKATIHYCNIKIPAGKELCATDNGLVFTIDKSTFVLTGENPTANAERVTLYNKRNTQRNYLDKVTPAANNYDEYNKETTLNQLMPGHKAIFKQDNKLVLLKVVGCPGQMCRVCTENGTMGWLVGSTNVFIDPSQEEEAANIRKLVEEESRILGLTKV